MPSYKQIKEFIETAKGEQLRKNTILIPDWLIWMFHYIDFWTLVGAGFCFCQSFCMTSISLNKIICLFVSTWFSVICFVFF